MQVSVGGGTGGGTGGVIRSQSSVEVAVRWAPDMLGPPKQEGHLIIKMVGGALRGMHGTQAVVMTHAHNVPPP